MTENRAVEDWLKREGKMISAKQSIKGEKQQYGDR